MKVTTNIDAALRYDPVVKDIISSNLAEQELLEVGSGTNGISDFLDSPVVGVDENFGKTKQPKNPNIRHVKGSILKIPFKDGSFPVVVCLDTLEHVGESDRQQAVDELMRVLKKGGRLYLGFPTGYLSRISEELISLLFKLRHKKDHPWLIEHRQFGLPSTNTLKKTFKRRIKVIHNVNLVFWLLIHWLFTVYGGSRLSLKIDNRDFWIMISNLIKIGPYYRDILIIQK